ncbi:hypothetical protein IQ247_22875 [Plectonema cf. radiosum LEGE 06105]|uniref:NHL repeat-containing protein n=1 Tax=Plectonema cf. radiosum LEGE 06105 TaxID=945769 RepID=A0A8J7K629_9CYAN|nr:hypothetical protein [Plectonema radiosum]MBE9215472.1 hypothetical protein [Plectonema cf. radiosum LEGE 06105]
MKNNFLIRLSRLSLYIKSLIVHGNIRYGKTEKFLLFLSAVLAISMLVTIHLDGKVTPAASSSRYRTSWIGNSFGGGDKWVQIQVSGMYVAPDGTIYTNSLWDEAGREVGIYRNGDVIGKADDLHGWGRNGGVAITADNKYIYVAMKQSGIDQKKDGFPPKGTNWYCVRRYDLTGKTAPFSNGKGWDKSMLIVSNDSEVTGLAAVGGELFVSDSATNKVRVYNSSTMQELSSFNLEKPGNITVDKKGNLWIIGDNKIVHYSKQGKRLPQVISGLDKPNAVAVDNRGRLLVADNGIKQQVLIYDITNQPKLINTFGVKGGIYAGIPGEVKDLKFYGISGVGSDSWGNIYISNDGFERSGVDLRKFSASGKLEWKLLGLQFIDNGDVDPVKNGLDVYTKNERFVMDYSKPAGKEATYKGYTLNAFKYPQDSRLHTAPDAPFIRHIQGKTFLYLTDMYGGMLQIYRFNRQTDGEIAIPSGMFVGTHPNGKPALGNNFPPFQPLEGEWIWRDKNGNGAFDRDEYDKSKDYPYIGGWWVDSKGDVWKSLRTQDGVGIRHFPLQGLDKNGNPIYSYSKMEKIGHPKIFGDLRRIEYFPETDTMYLSGYTPDNPAINGDYAKLIGSEIARYDNWSKGNRIPKWRIVLPVDKSAPPEVLNPAAMSIAGDYVFAVTVKKAEVYVYDAKTGKQVRILKPGAEVFGETGWVDIPYGVRAFQRKNGEYLVFVEEDAKAKVIMYRFNG